MSSFVERVAKNNSKNNGHRQKTLLNFPESLFCFLYNFSLTDSTQFHNGSNYNGKSIATDCSMGFVLVLVCLRKLFGHQAIFANNSIRSPSEEHYNTTQCNKLPFSHKETKSTDKMFYKLLHMFVE